MGKSQLMKKVVAWALCALLACTMLPAVAFAGGGGLAAGGISVVGDAGALDAQAKKPTLVFTKALSGKVTLKLGSTYSLGAKASKGAKVTYFSATPGRVSVTKAGKLKARAAGTSYVTVTASAGGRETTKTVKVRVVPANKYKAVKSISAKPGKPSLYAKQSTQIKVKFNPKSPSNKNLVYTNLTPRVASVSAKGKITAKGSGTAKVRVTSAENPKAKSTVEVRVSAKRAPKLNDYSWAQLKAISKKIAAAKSDEAGLAIAMRYGLVDANGKLRGAKKSLTLAGGTKTSVRILGFRQDRLASGKLAGISFEFADVPMNHVMNNKGTNRGGWALSKMRSWLNSSFYKQLPSNLRKYIAPAKKKTNNVGYVSNENDTSVVSSTSDKLWLLSSTEVYGKLDSSYAAIYNVEGKQYKLYSDKRVTTNNYSFCQKSGADSRWWLRSPHANYSGYFLYVYSNGGWHSYNAYYTNGVSPGFCF